MSREYNELPTPRTQALNPLPGSGPRPRLPEFFPPYLPASRSAFPAYALDREDIGRAFAERDEQGWAEHRAQRMQLVCAPLEQLMDAADNPARAPRETRPGATGDERRESVSVALFERAQPQDIRAIARYHRHCALREGAGAGGRLSAGYTLESLSVLPAHRGKGYDRVLASALGALIARELEQIADSLWHTHTLAVQIGFTSQLRRERTLNRIVAERLRDELVAVDSILQLDGKLSRMLPLRSSIQ